MSDRTEDVGCVLTRCVDGRFDGGVHQMGNVKSLTVGFDVNNRLVFVSLHYMSDHVLNFGDKTMSDPNKQYNVFNKTLNKLDYITTIDVTYRPGTLREPLGYINSVQFTTAHGVRSLRMGDTKEKKGDKNFTLCGRAGTPLTAIHGKVGPDSVFLTLGAHFKLPLRVGSRGAPGGSEWDDGYYLRVKQVNVGRSRFGIKYLKFEYINSDKTTVAKKQGKMPANIEGFYDELPVPENDYIEAVTGTYTGNLLTYLTFRLHNGKKVHTYGQENGQAFNLGGQSRSRIVGFHGRSTNDSITALGVHLV